MMAMRVPGPGLRPFVKLLWASEDAPNAPGARELVLPTGMMHVALRLSDAPLRLFDSVDAERSRTVGTAVVGGARARFYVRDVSQAVRTVGAQLEPGTASLLLGLPADELAGQHTPLDALWGSSVASMRAQLAEAPTLESRLLLFERLLFARLPRIRGLHPAVAAGLVRLACDADVAAAVDASGYSHRRFTTLFRAAVGLPPKLYCRVQRFEQALARVGRTPQPSWSALAFATGYSDQAHFNRDFLEFAGLTPGRYRALAPTFAHHVPLPPEAERVERAPP
jgi:AraC-like DNA-binding protein